MGRPVHGPGTASAVKISANRCVLDTGMTHVLLFFLFYCKTGQRLPGVWPAVMVLNPNVTKHKQPSAGQLDLSAGCMHTSMAILMCPSWHRSQQISVTAKGQSDNVTSVVSCYWEQSSNQPDWLEQM